MRQLNFIKSERRMLRWKQVEFGEDGKVYFRYKQRIYR